ncbi:hypothetical protein EU538_09385 [Candidatus Thorarchaeota archaeon]|nr:MAG: hypothetical protein EU538_09385 [Candidatus Thorarchaeota archaeon]
MKPNSHNRGKRLKPPLVDISAEVDRLRRHHVILGIVFVLVLLPVPNAKAQYDTRLYHNETLRSQRIMSTLNKYYYANLTAGSWTVVVQMDGLWGLNFAVTVRDRDTSAVLAEAAGSSISLPFTLDEDTLVNILVEQVGGISGYFNIGVYNGFDAIVASYGIWLIIIPAAVIGLIVVVGYRGRSRVRATDEDGMQVEAPDFVIPQRYRQQAETSDIRTVRLPAKCPSCGASLSQEDIDWTGPLEAKCNYCGSVVRARLEQL